VEETGLEETRLKETGLDLRLLQAQSLALQRRILRRLCQPHDLALDFSHLEALREFALAGHAGCLKLPRGFSAEIVRQKLLPPRLRLLTPGQSQPFVSYCVELTVPGSVPLAGFWEGKQMHVRANLLDEQSVSLAYNRASFLSSTQVGRTLTIRSLLPGDRFHPLCASGERKINRLLQELSIPVVIRRSWPVALAGESIVWVPGLSVVKNLAWSPGDGEAIVLEMVAGEGTIFSWKR
jgi:tRNA(Ile)-lysidine synthase